jgi:hypothetical protein
LKSVGLSQASMPLLNRTTVTPRSAISLRSRTAPAAGGLAMSSLAPAASFHAVTATASAF